LVVVYYYSRYYEYAILQSTVTEKIIDLLEEMFSRHGLPLTLKSDNGPQFVSEEFKAYCLQNNVKQVRVTPKWAQANGEVERQNQSILKRIQIAQAESLDWKRELRKYVFKYRSTEHATTSKTPAELLFGRKIRGKLPDYNTTKCYDLATKTRRERQSKDLR
jgi:transposase InsO family protein